MGPNVWEPYQSLSQSSSSGSLLRALRRTHVWQMDATLRLHMRVFLVQALRQHSNVWHSNALCRADLP